MLEDCSGWHLSDTLYNRLITALLPMPASQAAACSDGLLPTASAAVLSHPWVRAQALMAGALSLTRAD